MKGFIIFLIICLTGWPYQTNAQKNIKGEIIDSESKSSIPYSTIEIPLLNKGTIADSLGIFSIEIPDTCEKITLEISSLGYKPSALQLDLTETKSETIKINLTKEVYLLDEINITPTALIEKEVGILEKKSKYDLFGVIGVQHGILIKNPSEENGFIAKLSFYINKNGFPNCPFRIRIYEFDQSKNQPGKNILNRNLIVTNPNKGNNWFTVDVSDFSLIFPKEGVFIAMQWINDGEYYTFPVNF